MGSMKSTVNYRHLKSEVRRLSRIAIKEEMKKKGKKVSLIKGSFLTECANELVGMKYWDQAMYNLLSTEGFDEI